VYGVVVDDGAVDEAATAAARERQRAARRARSRVVGAPRGKADLAAGRRVDDNLVELPDPAGAGTVVACRHCGEVLGGAGAGEALAVGVHEGPSSGAGPQILADPADCVDAPAVFRQYCCPSCWTALYSAVVPADHPGALESLGKLVAPTG